MGADLRYAIADAKDLITGRPEASALGLAAPAPRPQLSAPCRRALRDAFAVRDSLLKVRNASSCLADIEWTSRAPCGAGGAPNAHASLKDSAAHALP